MSSGPYAIAHDRHNFEQIRILMEGEFGFGAEQIQKAGSLGYFCEGTYYTQNARGRSVTLLLQVGGPSGQGFMPRDQLREGIAQLKGQGEFHEGVYTWHDENGKKHNQDSFEAVWEHMHGRKVHYPKPQFDAPVMLQPERFAWTPCAGSPGVSARRMACFHEKGLEIAQLRLEAGVSYRFEASSKPWLFFCLSGDGQVDGEVWRKWTAVECLHGETLNLHAQTASEFWMLGLPVFESALPAPG